MCICTKKTPSESIILKISKSVQKICMGLRNIDIHILTNFEKNIYFNRIGKQARYFTIGIYSANAFH